MEARLREGMFATMNTLALQISSLYQQAIDEALAAKDKLEKENESLI